ncbi:ras-related protein Rab-24-like [Corticium candelabrum]|uniref:ras-related protein Rab-24-like n=1 Tax=Corticium candelabrum TaxID=121492 RepID=UPI002E25DB5F|nr:ras-related protein Rab-24-like [Corticium candelabrum]
MAAKVDLKIVILGKEYGGKTSLVERYLHDKFGDVPYQATIGAAFGAKTVTLEDGHRLTLGIWDTAGAERYEAMSKLYYRGAKAAVVCFDLTDISHFERAQFWVNELKTHEENCRVYLCGTKYDLVKENKKLRKIDSVHVEKFAEDIPASVHETSAKTGYNVGEMFQQIAEDFGKSEGLVTANSNNISQHQDGDTQGQVDLAAPPVKQHCCPTL